MGGRGSRGGCRGGFNAGLRIATWEASEGRGHLGRAFVGLLYTQDRDDRNESDLCHRNFVPSGRGVEM